jgi:hypothetical protein
MQKNIMGNNEEEDVEVGAASRSLCFKRNMGDNGQRLL